VFNHVGFFSPLAKMDFEMKTKANCFTVGVLGFAPLLLSLGGCATSNRPDVPSNAMQESSGGMVVAFTAPHDGKAYLRDDTDNCVVYSTDLRRDQVMRFDPTPGVVRIDGNTAPEGIAKPGHDHSIYFARSAQPDRTDVSNNVTTGDNANGVTTVHVPIGVQVDVQKQPTAPN
jgi:hypothetical protein